jgi:hypothetical protein
MDADVTLPALSRQLPVAVEVALASPEYGLDVQLAMPDSASVPFHVLVDGQPPGTSHGLDVDEDGQGTVAEQRLYQLVRQEGSIRDRTFEIVFLAPGAEAYCFTFG